MAGTDSLTATITGPNLQGVYLHDPDDAIGTIRQFFYAPSGKSEDRSITSDMLMFAGRARPVAEFGENQSDRVSVEFLIPFDTDWSTNVTNARNIYKAFKTYVYRDNRGRSWYGVLRSISFGDVDTGTKVSFTFERTDFSAVPASLAFSALVGE